MAPQRVPLRQMTYSTLDTIALSHHQPFYSPAWSMRTLAIETSCDDTSMALVSHHNGIRTCEAMVTRSQYSHNAFGWVVPNTASEEHARVILDVWKELCEGQPDSLMQTIDCISVTTSPWLPWSLTIWRVAAHTLWSWYHKPIVAVNHLDGHAFSCLLDRHDDDCPLPALVLSVSGGHSDLILITNQLSHHVTSVRHCGPWSLFSLGCTRDDAVGEVFDKVARALGGPYPGGKWLDDRAGTYQPPAHEANPFTQPKWFAWSLDFSFSGLKRQVIASLNHQTLTDEIIARTAYRFQTTAINTLIHHLDHAYDLYNPVSVMIVGGVSANSRLRQAAHDRCSHKTVQLLFPTQMRYCVDNAAMIGVAWLLQYQHTHHEIV